MQTPIANTVAAGNAAYATGPQCAADAIYAIITTVTAYNSSGGALDLTLAIIRADGTTRIQAFANIASAATVSFNRGATAPITPFNLLPGEHLDAKGSNTGLEVTYSGLQFS